MYIREEDALVKRGQQELQVSISVITAYRADVDKIGISQRWSTITSGGQRWSTMVNGGQKRKKKSSGRIHSMH